MAKSKSLSSLVRQVGQQIRCSSGGTTVGSDGPKIFNILDYIEQSWGLGMSLFPAQRFIVKLYYGLELDTTIPEDVNQRIQVTDMFKSRVLYELSEVDYLKYLFNEGRCNIGVQDHNRRELVLPIGRRGGKCVEGETLVLTDKGVFPIAELGSAPQEEFAPLDIGVIQEGRRRSRSSAFYNGGVKPTFDVTTTSGYRICGTGNHRVKVMQPDGQVGWRYLSEIRPGEFLAVNRGTDLWATAPVNLDSFREDPRLPSTVNERLGHLLGCLAIGGSWRVAGFEARLHEALNGVSLESWPCAERFLTSLGCNIQTSDSDGVPWAILRSPRLVVCAFIRGLFEASREGGKVANISMASFRLAREVQTLLLNLGIVSRLIRKWNSTSDKAYAVLDIRGDLAHKLLEQVLGYKVTPKAASIKVNGVVKKFPNIEDIPCQTNRVRSWLEAVPEVASVLKVSDKLTYPRLHKALSVARNFAPEHEATQHFEALLSNDYLYDAVISVKPGAKQVYDLTVPEGASFVANGFTNHNTTLSGIFASYEVYRLLNLYNPQSYYGLPNGNRIQIMSVATGKEQAGLLFNEVTTHLAKCEYFKPFIANNTLSHVNFRTPYDIEKFGPTARQENGKFVSFNGKATLRVTFNSCIAKGLRGHGNIVIILDEVAHFQDQGSSSALEVYNAVTPSSAAYSRKDPKTHRPAIDPVTGKESEVESRIILISSPLGRSGLFYDRYDLAMRGGEGSENLLAIQAPTWEINPTVPSAYYRQKYHENPDVFMVEHGAQFSDQTRGWIERESELIACVEQHLRPKRMAPPRMPHQMGIDVGLVRGGDGTTVAITHTEEDRVVLDYHEGWYAGVDWCETNPHLDGAYSVDYARKIVDVERLDFDEIAEWIKVLCQRFHITSGLFDRWNGIPLEQALHKRGLKQFRSEFFPRDLTSKMYQTFKLFMYDKKLALYDYPIPERTTEGVKHSPLLAELLSLQATQTSKNLIVVAAPQRVGSHDDFSDALVRSVWLSTDVLLNHKSPAYGSPYRASFSSGLTSRQYQLTRALRHGRPARGVPSRIRSR